jgi:hypothetical protein
MTMFDERERAFEKQFAHEEELRFLALVRRNQIFARWAAEQLGLRGTSLQDYVRSFVEGAVRPDPQAALIERVGADLLAEGVETSEDRILAAFAAASVEAVRQVRTETRARIA